MPAEWVMHLKLDPLPALQNSGDMALEYCIRRDLLDQSVMPVQNLWHLPEPAKLVGKQKADGSWKHEEGGSPSVPGQNYALLETYRNLRVLVEMYGLTREHPVIERAAGFIFTCQTTGGDIRGIIGNQYMPYYHGAILELLVKAGYGGDPRLVAGLNWLLTMRQDDGGWIVPAQAVPSKERMAEFWAGPPVEPDRSLPHAHMATGMVLRAFAVHDDYRTRPEIQTAGVCLKNRLLSMDRYNDRRAVHYWFKFQFPFWWTSLVSALDTLSRLEFKCDDPDIHKALDWFTNHQQSDGLWPTGYDKGRKSRSNQLWVGLAVCRILRRFYS